MFAVKILEWEGMALIWVFVLSFITTTIFLWIAIPYLIMNYLRKKKEIFREKIEENTEKRLEIVRKFCDLVDKDLKEEMQNMLDDFRFALSQVDRSDIEGKIMRRFFEILDNLRNIDEWRRRVKLWELESEMKRLNDEMERLRKFHNDVVESHNRKCKKLIFLLAVKMFNIKPMDTL